MPLHQTLASRFEVLVEHGLELKDERFAMLQFLSLNPLLEIPGGKVAILGKFMGLFLGGGHVERFG